MITNDVPDPKPTRATKSTPTEVTALWVEPKRGQVLIADAARNLRLLPAEQWNGEATFTVEDFSQLPAPDLINVVMDGKLTTNDIVEVLALSGIVSAETITRPALLDAMQTLLARIDLLTRK